MWLQPSRPGRRYLPQFSRAYLRQASNAVGRGRELEAPSSADSSSTMRRTGSASIHLDGLRARFTHALFEDGPASIVQEIGEGRRGGRIEAHTVHAEDTETWQPSLRTRHSSVGSRWVWADDFHHVVPKHDGRDRTLTMRLRGIAAELATIIREGWLYSGQYSAHMHHVRGTDPGRVPMYRSVVCLAEP